jgi:choline dehydrogenase-like flavoprotein
MTSFDHVVVGAGSAGCVLAHRLSADPQVSVLLVEAGDTNPLIEVPGRYATLMADPGIRRVPRDRHVRAGPEDDDVVDPRPAWHARDFILEGS